MNWRHREHHVCDRQHHDLNRLPLSNVLPGETVELVEIHSGRTLRKRLADLGLNIGMTVRVVQGNHHGPVILAVKEDSRLAIGRGMAHKIMTRRVYERPRISP